MATASKLNPYRRTNVENRFKGDDPTANPLADKVAGVKGLEASPSGEDPEENLGEELGELAFLLPKDGKKPAPDEPGESLEEEIPEIAALLKSKGGKDDLSADEMLDDSDLPEGVTDKTIWMAAMEQAEEEGKADDVEYVKALYDEMVKTEAAEEEAGMDLDGDEEKGEDPAHAAKVLGEKKPNPFEKKTPSFADKNSDEGPPPEKKKNKSFFNLMGYGKK